MASNSGLTDADRFTKSRAYTLEQLSFDNFSLFYSALLTLVLLCSGLLPWFDKTLLHLCGDGLHRGVLFLVGVTAVPSILKLPLTLYSTFRIEGKFGFNTMTWGLFWRDFAKELAMTLVLGLPLLYALLFLFRFTNSTWWLWAFGLILFFQLGMLVVYPTLIAPLFNRFKPLEESELKSNLLSLAERLHFPAAGIFVMDGSRRSLHSNAYFTGLGKWRRIVLYDTLIRQMDNSELTSILAHEIGHYKRNHIYKMMATQVFMLGSLLFLASLALKWEPLYSAFGFQFSSRPPAVETSSPAVGLFLFLSVFSSLSMLLSPFMNHVSRKHEYEADAYAVLSTDDIPSMRSALIKLSRENLTNLTPHPWYSAFHYSHPSLAERIKALEATKK